MTDRRWLLHASAAIFMNMHPTLGAQQKAARPWFIHARPQWSAPDDARQAAEGLAPKGRARG